MKTKLIYGLLLSLPIIGFSQTPEQIKVIQGKSNTRELKRIQSKLELIEKEKSERVQMYLALHPKTTVDSISGNTSYHLTDIVNNETPIYIQTHNVNSSKATRTNALNTGGDLGLNLDGENMIVGVWDEEAVRVDHIEFGDGNGGSRVTIMDSESSSGGHGTHVGGTIAAAGSFNSDAKGMAPKANIYTYNWINDESEATNAAANGLLISNHSYGLASFSSTSPYSIQVPTWYLGCYNGDAASWDEILFNAPYYLMVASAGNDGQRTNPSPSGGNGTSYDKLGTDKNAKNNLVVANAQVSTNSLGDITNLVINPSSSQGPTDDYRIKPDITGDGTQVLSTWNSSPVAYSTQTGTSMASPNVAGSLILLQEYYYSLHQSYMRSATLKGLACHTALDDNNRPGPDPIFGWGLLDTKAAAETITADDNNTAKIEELTLEAGQTFTTTITTSNPSELSATICWTDPAGESQSGSLNDDTAVLVNDLDLRITDEDGNEYMPYYLLTGAPFLEAQIGDNSVDNIEKVVVTSQQMVETTFTITVSHKGATLYNPDNVADPKQNFSLIITGSDLILSNSKQEFSAINAYPNPTSDVLTVSLDKAYNNLNFKLVDINGRIIYNQTANNSVSNYQISTSNLATGIYILQVEDDTHFYTQKIIKR